MSFTSLDLDPATSPVTVVISRPDGSPITGNGPISQCFGVDASGNPYFDPYPDAGQAATLGYDGSRGRFFLATQEFADPHLMRLAREERAASRIAEAAPPRVRPVRPVIGARQRTGRARARRDLPVTTRVVELPSGTATGRHERAERHPAPVPVDSRSRMARETVRVPVTIRVDTTARGARAAARTPVALTVDTGAREQRANTRQPVTVPAAGEGRAARALARQPAPVAATDDHGQTARAIARRPQTLIEREEQLAARDLRARAQGRP